MRGQWSRAELGGAKRVKLGGRSRRLEMRRESAKVVKPACRRAWEGERLAWRLSARIGKQKMVKKMRVLRKRPRSMVTAIARSSLLFFVEFRG